MFIYEDNKIFINNLNEREVNQVLDLLDSHPEINEVTVVRNNDNELLKTLADSNKSKNITSLILRNNDITDEGIKHLPTNLNSLGFSHCNNLTSEGLKKLSPKINSLNLNYSDSINETIKYLPKTLNSLNLDNTNITDEGMKYLPKTLNSLDLELCPRITDKGLQNLPLNLTFLNIILVM